MSGDSYRYQTVAVMAECAPKRTNVGYADTFIAHDEEQLVSVA
jgi:hypothetical protein